jgi:hypothetical protein
MNAAELAQAEITRYRGAVTHAQAVILACARADRLPLDPQNPTHAALLLRAEQLTSAGSKVRAAIHQARQELRDSHPDLPAARHDRNGATAPCSPEDFPPHPDTPVCGDPHHRRLWCARDRRWRCLRCSPPRLAGEIVARAVVQS